MLHTRIRKAFLALALTASLAAVKSIESSESVVLTQVCGRESQMRAMSYALRCYSISNQLNDCIFLAANAGTYRDLKNTGQTTYSELRTKLDNASGADVVLEENGLSLTEAAPANLSSVQLVHDIYKQCASYVVIH